MEKTYAEWASEFRKRVRLSKEEWEAVVIFARFLDKAAPHSPASVSRPEGPRGDERMPDGRSEEGEKW